MHTDTKQLSCDHRGGPSRAGRVRWKRLRLVSGQHNRAGPAVPPVQVLFGGCSTICQGRLLVA
jgi:hypothetical protein